MGKTFIYEFLWNPCIYESSSGTMSVHRTKIGAYKAMNKWLNDRYNKEYDNYLTIYGKKMYRDSWYCTWKVGTHECWSINEIELKD